MSAVDAESRRRAVEDAQLTSLNNLLSALSANAYYAPIIQASACGGGVDSLAAFRERFPLTIKQQLIEDRAAHPPYGTNLTYPVGRYTRYSQTSGTTGVPMRWLDTNESWDLMVRCWMEVLQAAGVGAGDRIFFAFSFGPFIGFWLAFEAAARLGCLCIPGGGMSSAARLRAILDNQVTVLCCTPTYALRLAEVAAEEGIDLSQSRVRRMLIAGEPGASIPATRSRIESAWPGGAVFDHHGMTEVGPVTYECPRRPGALHIMESEFLAEVVDPASGSQVEPGAEGELVLTTLGRIASPVLRYRTGDLVRLARETVCVCGRVELSLEGGILGRTDDMVVIRGVNIHPSAVEDVLRGFPQAVEYRVTITSAAALREVRVELEPAPTCVDVAALCHEVETALRSAFNLRIPVTHVPANTLPRFELKSRRWIRE